MRFLIVLLLTAPLYAVPFIKMGYRYGYMRTELESQMKDGTFLFSDSTTLKALNFFQIEGERDLYFIEKFFLRAQGGYAFLLSGYNDEDSIKKVFKRKASLHEGGLGFAALSLNALLPLRLCKIGPFAGFYFQQFNSRTINGDRCIYPENLEEVEYISRWRAPKWGVLAQRKASHSFFEASYAYASSDWQGNWRLKGYALPDEIFSEKRFAKSNQGHFLHFKWDRFFSKCRWGCVIGYEFLSAKRGEAIAESLEIRERMKQEQVVDLVLNTTWHSITALIELGIVF